MSVKPTLYITSLTFDYCPPVATKTSVERTLYIVLAVTSHFLCRLLSIHLYLILHFLNI